MSPRRRTSCCGSGSALAAAKRLVKSRPASPARSPDFPQGVQIVTIVNDSTIEEAGQRFSQRAAWTCFGTDPRCLPTFVNID